MAKSNKGSTKGKGKVECYIWTDDEVELLLKVTEEYKVKQTAENIDWESCQSKYSDILYLFKSQYPSAENAKDIGKDFPHNKEDITKVIITTKLKAIRSKFRAAVDSGKKSGHGRVVLLYFEVCEAIWGGSPATSTINAGFESADITVDSINSSSTPSSPASSTIFDSDISQETDNIETSKEVQESEVKKRRNLLDAKLRGYKQEKLRKISSENELIILAREEMQMKKRMLEKIDEMDQEHSQHLARLTTSMEQLTGSIADGFAMLKSMMQPTSFPLQHLPQHNPLPFTRTHSNSYAQCTQVAVSGHDKYNLTTLQPRYPEQSGVFPNYS